MLTVWPFSNLSEKNKRQIRVFFTIGYWPNVKNPKSFNEWLSYEFLFGNKEHVLKVHDKFAVRKYVEELGLGKYLSIVYKVFQNESEVDFSNLPDKFVVKSNYGGSSKHVIIVKEFHSLSVTEIETIKNRCKKWLSNDEIKRQMSDNFFIKDIKPVVLIEEFLEDAEFSPPLDYKYYIINGKIAFIEVVQGRFEKGSYVTIYDYNWNRLTFTHGNPIGNDIKKTQNLKEMNELAIKLSEDFDFARIDLYNINQEGIVFGEITPFPGTLPFKPRKYDVLFGQQWKLNKTKKL